MMCILPLMWALQMLSSIWDDQTSPLLSPTVLPAGPADDSSRCASLPLAGQPAPPTGSVAEFHVSSLMQETLQRIVGGEEGVSTCQPAGKGKISEIRQNGVFHAATPPLAKRPITSARDQMVTFDLRWGVRKMAAIMFRTQMLLRDLSVIRHDGKRAQFQPG